MRICSLLPAATEMAFALGLSDQIVGVTLECDYPPEARQKQIVVRCLVDTTEMTSAEINRWLAENLQDGKSPYSIDEEAFLRAAPDLILTQGLCEVCALDYNYVVQVAQSLPHKPNIVSLNPNSVTDVLDDILRVGDATQRRVAAQALVTDLQRRILQVRAAAPTYRPRVACFEWLEPLFVAGHWVPEMVEIAGGEAGLIRTGEPSVYVAWQSVLEFSPEVIVLLPCGFDVRRTINDSPLLQQLEGWPDLPAVKAGKVFAVNGNAYFSRPGPRLISGLEILARLIHPEKATGSLSPAEAAKFN